MQHTVGTSLLFSSHLTLADVEKVAKLKGQWLGDVGDLVDPVRHDFLALVDAPRQTECVIVGHMLAFRSPSFSKQI